LRERYKYTTYSKILAGPIAPSSYSFFGSTLSHNPNPQTSLTSPCTINHIIKDVLAPPAPIHLLSPAPPALHAHQTLKSPQSNGPAKPRLRPHHETGIQEIPAPAVGVDRDDNVQHELLRPLEIPSKLHVCPTDLSRKCID